MLDAPCSNTGVIQRRTDVKWRLKESDIEDCAKLQQQLIHSAARFVKPGGRLVYSTCSIEPIENRQIIDGFLSSKSGQSFNLAREEISSLGSPDTTVPQRFFSKRRMALLTGFTGLYQSQ